MQLYDRRLMQLLTFLTRRQGWLSPLQIGKEFRPDGKPVTVRTIHRWLSVLRSQGYLVYYPYPRANLLGLQEVLVWIRGLQSPDVLGMLPFGSCFSVDVGLGDARPFITQGYWIPFPALEDFRVLWQVATEEELLGEVELFPTKNSYFFFSPFEEVVREDGVAEIGGPIDNGYFERLARKNFQEPFQRELGGLLRNSPLLIPLVFEHVWTHSSSRQVWSAIRSKGVDHVMAYVKGKQARSLRRPGSALRLLQRQWNHLLENFDGVFLQPRISWNWRSLDRHIFVSLIFDTGSTGQMMEAARQASELSIWAALRPGLPPDTRCYISCFLPEAQLLSLVQIVGEFHRGARSPVVAIQDEGVTADLFQTPFCKVDWTMFDPFQLRWKFPTESYMARIQSLRPRPEGTMIYAE